MDISNVTNWFNRFFGISSRSVIRTGSNQIVNNNPPVYADASTETFINKGFAGNASVYTIIAKASKKFGNINRGVYEVNNKKAFKKYNNLCKSGLGTTAALLNAVRFRNKAYSEGDTVQGKLNDLLARPNKLQGQDSFFELVNINYLATGEAFIWLNRGDVPDDMDDSAVAKMEVLEMYVLPSWLVDVVPDDEDPFEIVSYIFNLYGNHGSQWKIRACDIIHWKKANPCWDSGQQRGHLRGLSPLKAGIKILQMDSDSTDATVSMYQNGGAKGVLSNETLDKLSPTQETQLRAVVDGKLNNKAMKAAVATLQGKWVYTNIGLDSVDQELLKGGEQAFTRLCNLLDVPPSLFLTDQTYENKSASIKDWLTNSVIPAACSLRDEMNRVLLVAFKLNGTKAMIDNDISDIPELQEDMGKLVTWMAQFPWLTPNEKREYLGECASEEDGMDDIWIPNSLVKLSDAGMPDVVPPLDSAGLNDYNQAAGIPAKKPAKVAA